MCVTLPSHCLDRRCEHVTARVRCGMPRAMAAALLLPAVSLGAGAAPLPCEAEGSCAARVQGLNSALDSSRSIMAGKHLALDAIENLRSGVMGGERVNLLSTHRHHLEKTSPLVSEISLDAKHAPLSTNTAQHIKLVRTIAEDLKVRLHSIMPLKKPAAQQGIGPAALLVTIDSESRLSLHTFEGEAKLKGFDLGHGPGRTVTHLVLSPSQETHFVLTADDHGQIRVHNLKVIAKKEKVEVGALDPDSIDDLVEERVPVNQERPQKKLLVVTANFSCNFSLPSRVGEPVRKLNAVLPIDRGNQPVFVTGDSLGGIAVFHRNGTLKGRVKVSEDPGGVRGLLRSQGQTVLFFSSHSFGFLSVSQVDVQYPPCTGWNTPLYDIAPDPSYSHSRVILALSDGDVLIFSTSKGKSKACDLSLKFPHVSTLPFKLQVFRGHVIALPTPLEHTERKEEYLRELFFFNLNEMEDGYGTAVTQTVTLQASFKPKQPDHFAIYSGQSDAGDRWKVKLAMRYVDSPGIDLFELNLKQPPPPKSANDGSSWLDWFPKVGVFGIAMIGVVIWNVRKMSGGGFDDMDEDYFRDLTRQAGISEADLKGGGGGLSFDD